MDSQWCPLALSDGLPPPILQLFGCWEDCDGRGLLPLGSQWMKIRWRAAQLSQWLCPFILPPIPSRWFSDRTTQVGDRGRRKAGCSQQPYVHPTSCLHQLSTSSSSWGAAAEARSSVGAPGLCIRVAETLAPQPGSNSCSMTASSPCQWSEHPTVRNGEAGAPQWCSEQSFGTSSAAPWGFGATVAPQTSNPIANTFV